MSRTTKRNYYLYSSLEGRIEWLSGHKIRIKSVKVRAIRACFFSSELSGRMHPRLISLLRSQCRARSELAPFFSGRTSELAYPFFCICQRQIHTCTRAIPLNMQWECAWKFRVFSFFLATAFHLFPRASLSSSTFFLWKDSRAAFRMKNVISVDYLYLLT